MDIERDSQGVGGSVQTTINDEYYKVELATKKTKKKPLLG
jgi:hypothetical protein